MFLIAMSGDSAKPEIGTALTYFAVQTRRQEKMDRLTSDERRLQLRQRVSNAIVQLNTAAKKAGVQKYSLFHDAGYRGLYEMGLREIKAKKGKGEKETLLDRAGRTELAANEFRITQTEDKMFLENVTGEYNAIETHLNVGKEVRETIKKLGGTMPENLQPEPSIRKLTATKKRKELPSKMD